MLGRRRFTSVGMGKRPKSRRRTLRLENLSSRDLLAADFDLARVDVSGDGVLAPLDVLQVSNAVQRGATVEEFPQFDVNQDQVIDHRDVDLTLSFVVAELQNQHFLSSRPLCAHG